MSSSETPPPGVPGAAGGREEGGSTTREEALEGLQTRLKYRWRRRALLEKALRHQSTTPTDRTASNQRLEFIGDSVIDLVVGVALLERFPDRSEGFLAIERARLVNQTALAHLGRSLGLHLLALVDRRSPIHLQRDLRQADSTASECLEAVVGAAFIDSGLRFDVAVEVVRAAGILDG